MSQLKNTDDVIDGLPTARTCPFHPPTELGRLRQEQPIARMTYPDGGVGWLVTSDELARIVLTDQSFSSRHELRNSPIPMPVKLGPAMPGMFIGMDPPDHTRYRKPLTRQFTLRRIRDLEPKIKQITEDCLDAMELVGPSVDLMEAFALPLPVTVISEMLGAPQKVTDELQRLRVPVLLPQTPPEQAAEAARKTNELMLELVRHKRAHPGDDLLSGLIADDDLDDVELAGISFLLLVAGHETTANIFALSTYMALRDEKLRQSLSAEPRLTDAQANELLRHLSIVQYTNRAALTDIELGGVTVKEGETVTVSISAVNRDPARYADPDTFNSTATGRESGHIAFGHGIHQCIGNNLARAEMRIGIPELLRRFPRLRLAVPDEEITTREAMNTFGVHQLPVTW